MVVSPEYTLEESNRGWDCKEYQQELEEGSSWASWATSSTSPSGRQLPSLPQKAATGSSEELQQGVPQPWLGLTS